ncbi:putative methyltransferase DDB_G0268948 isoform X1 [Sycon ciliatum]|uniref:putative methyltransferase DDB_G0268948 isoform X1 n=1 Tax=Sycon ciliatum TaxID=27933 RepID=UPI0031F6D5F3
MAKSFLEVTSARRYAMFRPHYPEALLPKILSYLTRHSPGLSAHSTAGSNSKQQLAVEDMKVVDVACGAGQSTFFLAKAGFKRIHGMDISQAQINEATKALGRCDNAIQRQIDFQVNDAHSALPFKENSIDMVAVIQALHWFDHAALYKSIDKVLKPGGSFLALMYGHAEVLHEAAQIQFLETYFGELGRYWPPEARHAASLYYEMPVPYKPVERLWHILDFDTPVSNLAGLISSYSAYHKYSAQHPDTTILDDMAYRMSIALKSPAGTATTPSATTTSGDAEASVRVRLPLSGFMCRKPLDHQ